MFSLHCLTAYPYLKSCSYIYRYIHNYSHAQTNDTRCLCSGLVGVNAQCGAEVPVSVPLTDWIMSSRTAYTSQKLVTQQIFSQSDNMYLTSSCVLNALEVRLSWISRKLDISSPFETLYCSIISKLLYS